MACKNATLAHRKATLGHSNMLTQGRMSRIKVIVLDDYHNDPFWPATSVNGPNLKA